IEDDLNLLVGTRQAGAAAQGMTTTRSGRGDVATRARQGARMHAAVAATCGADVPTQGGEIDAAAGSWCASRQHGALGPAGGVITGIVDTRLRTQLGSDLGILHRLQLLTHREQPLLRRLALTRTFSGGALFGLFDLRLRCEPRRRL